MFVDSHAHLQWASFDHDRDAVIERARAAGVTRIVNIGFDMAGRRQGIELAAQHDRLYATVGLHPHNASQFNEAALDELRRLARQAKVVAIGEIGLDYYRNRSPRVAQQQAFEAQMRLAEEVGLPVVVHDRDAHQEVLEVLSRFAGRVEGVMHCFSGNQALAEQCIDLGFYISFAGTVTFPNARQLQAVAREIDVNKVLLETDSPWLAPQAMRGQRNEPAFLPFIAETVAALKGVSVEVLGEKTTRNVEKIFHIK